MKKMTIFFYFKVSSGIEGNELKNFLSLGERNVNIVHSFLLLEELFIKYSTQIPSSASVERLFSEAREVLHYKRRRMGDNTLEEQLLLNFKNV